MQIINKLKNEIKVVKWPNKQTVKKDFIITISVSICLILALSFINILTNLLLSLVL